MEQNETVKPEWRFESEEDKAMEIETITYENGNQAKRIKLSDGREAVIRELKGKDVQEADRLHGGKESLFLFAMCALSTKIGGAGVVMEDLMDLRAKDYNRIRVAVSALNF